MGEVIKKNFGKAERDYARKLLHLMKLAHIHEDDILRNPIPYLEKMQEQYCDLLMQIRKAQEVMHVQPGLIPPSTAYVPFTPIETMTVRKEDWTRLQAMRMIVEAIEV